MADSKTYRPKVDYEGFGLTAHFGQGRVLDLKPFDFPYATEDPGEQAYLDEREELTDRPEPKKSAGNASGQTKEA